MGIPDSSLLDLIEKVRSWISWGASDLWYNSGEEFQMPCKMCCECDAKFTGFSNGFRCQSCGRWLCTKCAQRNGSSFVDDSNDVKGNECSRESGMLCRFCNEVNVYRESGRKYCQKVHPSLSPRESPEPPSPCSNRKLTQDDRLDQYLEARDCGYSPQAVTGRRTTSFSKQQSPIFTRCSPSRSDEEDAEDSGKHFLSTSIEYCHDVSDVESSSFSARHESYSFKSISSRSVSPSRNSFTPYRDGRFVQQGHWNHGSPMPQNVGPLDQEGMANLRKIELQSEDPNVTDHCSDDVLGSQSQYEKSQKALDFENNGLIWHPPPPEDENDEAESSFFSYDDEDDDIGDSGAMFTSSSSLSSSFPAKDKQNENNKEPLRAVIQGHFRALVSQLLQGEGIEAGKEDYAEDWLDIVTALAWQAANFVKPDTSRGGSMDPGDYVKVKCIASGIPSNSTLIKGVVCTKNIKHKRMTTQYKNPRLLLLGGALEFQKASNQLASFNTLLQQENDHLKMIIAKIEALRPNVLLVEKSVSSYAQEYLLTKEISLVLNVKRTLLERIARCTGALVCPSIDNISSTRLGHCELFRLEKVSEERENANQFNKRPSKTLMFFEGCPRRLGCTVLLRGKSREELKKVKHVLQYAVFAAYHLSLETSFLADEGASLPKMKLKQTIPIPERMVADNSSLGLLDSLAASKHQVIADASSQDDEALSPNLDNGRLEMLQERHENHAFTSCQVVREGGLENALLDLCDDNLESIEGPNTHLVRKCSLRESSGLPYDNRDLLKRDVLETMSEEERNLGEVHEITRSETTFEDEVSSEYFSATDTHQSILVSFSSRCVLKGTVCERSRLLRIKFYGCFDKPLGRYLRDDLFDQSACCRSCNEPAEAHVLCYTHQQGNLTINVRRLESVKLPGERDGKIWMWHRCLRCAHVDGVPPATRRVVMSDAAWGLSFGKFLELSFSNHATANRVANCGHSLQRDCLRYYGFGSMVAFFHYSPIDILSVHLPPSELEFSVDVHQEWIRKEAAELLDKVDALYAEVSNVLDRIEQKMNSIRCQSIDATELQNHIQELREQHVKEKNDFDCMLQPVVMKSLQLGQSSLDILELNRLRRALLIGAHLWDHQLHSLDSLLKKVSAAKTEGDTTSAQLRELKTDCSQYRKLAEENVSRSSLDLESPRNVVHLEEDESNLPDMESTVPDNSEIITCHQKSGEDMHLEREPSVDETVSESIASASNLSERIDSAWTGTDLLKLKPQPLQVSQVDRLQAASSTFMNKIENPPVRRLRSPIRVHSFDSALRYQEIMRKGLPHSSSHFSTLRSFHASGDYRSMVRDPCSSITRTVSLILPLEAQKLSLLLSSTPYFISSASHMAEGARVLLPQRGHNDIVIAVYDDDPASIISYALSSKEYEDWVADRSSEQGGGWSATERSKEDSTSSTFSAWESFGSLDLDYIHYGSYGSEDVPSSMGTLFADAKRSPHLAISFEDDSATAGDKVRFSVTCYFARQFDILRKKCCPNEMDFLRSLSRCQKWSAEGGKSNVYFAKSLDDRFIIKQIKKTELESFEEFAPEYFKYLTDSLNSGSPTCLAKVLGIYQVSVKHLRSGKETKMDLMVMENLFFRRNISRIYDLKGSARSRYNPDTGGKNKVLLDMNLLETLRTEPIFLGSKAKRSLERAIWNDTSFLASVDVMDYSLLVGVDDERKELVLGIIDFMRQYTWDKHLETWVKASGILGGPKNASPTIISPKQYKKRFRKAMTSYFLTVPDQWTS